MDNRDTHKITNDSGTGLYCCTSCGEYEQGLDDNACHHPENHEGKETTFMGPPKFASKESVNRILEAQKLPEPKPGGAKAHHGHVPFALYSTYFLLLQPEFRKHGYALMTHGSGQRDLDMVAVPWGPALVEPEKVLAHITEKFGFEHNIDSTDPIKPWGRKAYIIGCGAGLYIDLSFTPRVTEKEQ